MSWIRIVLTSLSQLVELRQYGRGLGVGFGVLLMLLAIAGGSMTLLVFGGAIAAFAAFMPMGQP